MPLDLDVLDLVDSTPLLVMAILPGFCLRVRSAKRGAEVMCQLTLAVPFVGVDGAVVLHPAIGERDEGNGEDPASGRVASLRLAMFDHELEE